VAVNQIGIARELVNMLFMATVGAVALAAGLAFGLGGRETAAEIWREWYERSRRAAPRIGEAAENVRGDVEGGVRRHAEHHPSARHREGGFHNNARRLYRRGFALLGFCRFSLCASLEYLMLVKAEPLHMTYEVTQGDR
jgi:hypothetical protein